MIINFANLGGSVDAYTKAESDAKFAQITDLEDTELVVAEAVGMIKTSVGLNSALNYNSPISIGNTMAQDIAVLKGSAIGGTVPNKKELWYVSSGNTVVTPNVTSGWTNSGAQNEIVSNTYTDGLGKIVFDDTVTTFPTNCFSGKTELKMVWYPSNVTNASNSCYTNCGSLVYVYVPRTVTSINFSTQNAWAVDPSLGYYGSGCNIEREINPYDDTFLDVTITWGVLSALRLPKTVKNFNYGRYLKGKVEIPNGITRIKGMAFDQSSGVSEIHIPESVSLIENKAFYRPNTNKDIYFYSATPPTDQGSIAVQYESNFTLHVPLIGLAAYKQQYPNVKVVPIVSSQETLSVSGETVFQVWANAFYVTASSQNYTLNYSIDGTTWQTGQSVTAGDTLMANGFVRGMYFKLVGNNSTVNITY